MTQAGYTSCGGHADADRLARQAAQRAGIAASSVCADATRSVTRPALDLAYVRLLLSHRAEPMAALRAMGAAVRPGGVVAVEDLFTGTLRSDPPAPALERLQEVYSATVRFHGGDPDHRSPPARPAGQHRTHRRTRAAGGQPDDHGR
jgi:hypothetical protein